jgi:uncharacterized membrane protein HdeD (DUF308 family)
MTIPELMYGARRYGVRGYLGDDFTHLKAKAAQRASMSATFAAIANCTPAWSVVWPLLLILFGLLAIGLPLAISFGGILFVGWLLIMSSAIQVLHAFQPEDIASLPRKLAVALLYMGAGMYLLADPILGISRLNLAIGMFFIAEALVDLLGYVRARKSIGSSWLLSDGIGNLILGLLIWIQWPSSSSWAIATLVGISMLMTGSTRLMITLAAREHREAYMG